MVISTKGIRRWRSFPTAGDEALTRGRGSSEANSFLLTYSPKPYAKVVNPFNKKLENMLFQSVTQAAQKKKNLRPPNRSQTYDPVRL